MYFTFVSKETSKLVEAAETYTFFTVKDIAEVFVGLRVFADKSKYPFIGFVICAEGYSV